MDTLIPFKPCGQYMYHYVNMSANIAKINDIEYKWTLIPFKPCGQYMYHYVNMSANIANTLHEYLSYDPLKKKYKNYNNKSVFNSCTACPIGCFETSVIYTNQRCVTSQKIEDVIYTAAEA